MAVLRCQPAVRPPNGVDVNSPLLIESDRDQHGVGQERIYETVNCAYHKSL